MNGTVLPSLLPGPMMMMVAMTVGAMAAVMTTTMIEMMIGTTMTGEVALVRAPREVLRASSQPTHREGKRRHRRKLPDRARQFVFLPTLHSKL
ncbi:MAG: hypothetical protein AB3N15_01730 [Paracoccaceae bacterium]